MSYSASHSRLTGKADFDAVFSGDKWVTPELVFFYRSMETSRPRIGIVAGKKTIAKATARNRFKRRLRSLFRESIDKLDGRDVVVVARRGKKLGSYTALRSSFQQFLKAIRQ